MRWPCVPPSLSSRPSSPRSLRARRRSPRRHVPAAHRRPDVGFNEDYSLTRIWADSATATPWVAADADAAAAAGATVSRTPLYWRGVQPTEVPGTGAPTTASSAPTRRRGMRVIVNVSGTPDWASRSHDRRTRLRQGARQPLRHACSPASRSTTSPTARSTGAPRPTRRATSSSSAPATAAPCGQRALPVAGGIAGAEHEIVNGDMPHGPVPQPRCSRPAPRSCMDVISFHPYPFSTDLTSADEHVPAGVRADPQDARLLGKPSMRLWVSETGLSLQTAGITQAAAGDDDPRDLRHDRRDAPARRRRGRHPHARAVLRLARLRPRPAGS